MTPTKNSPAGKLVLSLGLIIVSFIYAVWQSISGSSSPSFTTPNQSYQAANNALQQTISQIRTATVSQQTAGTPAPAPTLQKPAGQYADGSYTGNPADAYYGTVQVKAVIQNGQIADVQFLQHPSDRSTSRYLNDQAMPLLTQEAIQAQSARVDGVSGATFTSQAFRQSLTSALAQAKI